MSIKRVGRWLGAIALGWFLITTAASAQEAPHRLPVVLDGRSLFAVGDLDDFSASERADFVNHVLQAQLRQLPPETPIQVTQLKRGELITLRVSGRHVLTITDQDLMGNIPAEEQADRWADKLQQALQQGRAQRTPAYRRRILIVAVGLAVLGLGLYFGLRGLRRWLRRHRRRLSPGARFWTEMGIYLAQWSLLIGFLGWVSQALPELRHWRYRGLNFLGTTLTADVVTLSDHGYSILEVSKILLLVVLLWLAVRAITGLVRARVLQTVGADPTAQDAIALFIQVALTGFGLLVLLQAFGVDVSSLAILASVIGVGIGFGLQNIANNFISGLIIMLERPVQVGDFVKLGDLTGTVERIGIRSTEISTLDRITIIVPNSEFIDSKVINWSHGFPVSRLHIPLGVAYSSPIKQVRQAVFEAARRHPKVLRYPKPQLWFEGFGDSSLDFNLLVWIREPRQQFRIRSDLYYLLEANLRRFHIEIPFPQRDLHLRSDALGLRDPASARPADRITSSPAVTVDEVQTLEEAIADCDILDHRDEPAELEIQELVAQMRGPNGLEIRDRRFGLQVYTRCFVGSDAVRWFMQRQLASREEAIRLGQILVERGIIHHVIDEHTFKDDHLFYRFFIDEAIEL
ncbi:MAG: mechanosensitive ion channel domain-containing protein [Leptolyngbyaceae cyanobacterium]